MDILRSFGWSLNSDFTIPSPMGVNTTLFQNDSEFPKFEEDGDLLWLFLRGYLEYHLSLGFSLSPKCTPICCIELERVPLMTKFNTISNIPYVQTETQIKFYGTNCIDFLGKLYDPKYAMIENVGVLKMFKNMIKMNDGDDLEIYKTDENAVLPTKGNFSDVGYDLTIIKEYKRLNESTMLYDTGIKVFPKFGYYTEIVPRSSLSKSGYMLANSIGVIENSYNGNLFIALTKVDKNSPDLTLPFKCCQLVIREQIYHNIKEIKELPSNDTTRGEGGFGSTN
jgi:dUTP pyrophosphatase